MMSPFSSIFIKKLIEKYWNIFLIFITLLSWKRIFVYVKKIFVHYQPSVVRSGGFAHDRVRVVAHGHALIGSSC